MILPNFPFATSETMCDYNSQTWHEGVTSRVSKPLNTSNLRQLVNIRKVSKFRGMIA